MKNFVDNRIYWKEIQGKRILFADYSNTQEEELFSIMKKHVSICIDFANKEKGETLLTLSIFKNNAVPEYSNLKTTQITMPSANINKISVVTGMTDFQQILLKACNLNRTNPFIVCNSVEESILYLINKSNELSNKKIDQVN